MMIITGITEVTKARSKVELDGEFAFVLYKGELRSYKIKIDSELKAEDYEEIMKKVLPKRAKLRSMNLLKTKDYTEEQLRRKLKDGLYPANVIEDAIEYVKGYHYIDDERYTRQYLEYFHVSKSKKKMMMDLLTKGVSKDLIIAVMEELEEEKKIGSEDTLIRRLLEKRHYNPDTMDYKEKRKMMTYLVGKGFAIEQIRRVMGESFEEYLT